MLLPVKLKPCWNNVFSTCLTEPMSTASSHQQLAEDVEDKEQREKFKCKDEISKEESKTASGDKTSKYSELQICSSELEETRENQADLAHATSTISPAGCTNTHIKSKFSETHWYISFFNSPNKTEVLNIDLFGNNFPK